MSFAPKITLKDSLQQLRKYDLGSEFAEDLDCLDKLMNFEEKIDQTISKKRLDIQELLAKTSFKLKAVLRIHIFTRFSPNGWEVVMAGKILTTTGTPLDEYIYKTKKFTSLVKAILFRNSDKDKPELLHWDKKSEVKDKDGFSISGTDKSDRTIEMKLLMEHSPSKYKLGGALEKLVGKDCATRQEILFSVWEYIKLAKLQDRERKGYINCDELLEEVLGKGSIKIDEICLKLKENLKQLDPIVMQYSFTYGSTIEENERIFDMSVEIDSPFTNDIMPHFAQKLILEEREIQKISTGQLKSHPFILITERIKSSDRKMGAIINIIKASASRSRAYEEFAKNPSLFIENLIYQQNKLLQVIKAKELARAEKCQLDERSIMQKLLTEYQDISYSEIKKYVSSLSLM